MFYLDDGTLAGPVEDVKHDLLHLERAAGEINLFLNHSKSEIICVDESTKLEMLSFSSSFHTTDPSKATLLGSPIGAKESLNMVWESKLDQLKTLGSRLEQLQAHDALCLLRNALSVPNVLYILHMAPSFQSSVLSAFDGLLRSLLESICNIRLTEESWIQASLPINQGGLGIRSVTMLAPSAYLASAAGTSSLTSTLLPTSFLSVTCPHQDEAHRLWKSSSGSSDPPTGRSMPLQPQ